MKLDKEQHREIILLALAQIPLKGTPEQIRGALEELEEVTIVVRAAEIESPEAVK